jgi:AraC-like DNA-binding protein
MVKEPAEVYKLNLHLRHGAVVIGDVLYPPGGVFGPRVQRDYQLVVIHRGSLRLRLDGTWIEVAEHEGILLAPGHREHFYFCSDRETHHSWIAVSPRAVPLNMRTEIKSYQGPAPFLGSMSSILEIARQRLPAADSNQTLENEFYRGLAVAALCDFVTASRRGGVGRVHGAILTRLEQFVFRRYSERHDLGSIAQAIGVSRQHLLRVCRINGRPTPIGHLYKRRLEVAADMLMNTGLSIGETAEQCGFANQFHFSRKFKENFDCSPFEWRSRYWKRRK